ncbi:MAG: 2-amino-4-hydroxy-6-hydroxymethyldihydropteridine diphosphokinase [Planctomycetota bacterium]
MPKGLVALGSNLGERRAALDAAIAAVEMMPSTSVDRISDYYETPSVGGPAGQGEFLNGVAVVHTGYSPEALLDALQAVESSLGRVRDERWAARSLDLDLLLYEEQVIATERLRVPHPRMSFRPFVLEPAVEVAGGWRHPELHATLNELRTNLQTGADGLRLAGDGPAFDTVRSILTAALPDVPAEHDASTNEAWWPLSRGAVATNRPKLQVLVGDAAEAIPAVPCLRLSEEVASRWSVELMAALTCVWPTRVWPASA